MASWGSVDEIKIMTVTDHTRVQVASELSDCAKSEDCCRILLGEEKADADPADSPLREQLP